MFPAPLAYPFIGGQKSYAGLASKKGVALTVGIAAAIIGSSFLIWYIPQSSPGTILGPPRGDNEVIGDVYTRHNDLATNMEMKFDQWKNNGTGSNDISTQIVSAKSELEQMRRDLNNHQPAQEWKESYSIYMRALDDYSAYLDAVESKVKANDRTDPDPKLNQEWRGLVDQSVAAMPI